MHMPYDKKLGNHIHKRERWEKILKVYYIRFANYLVLPATCNEIQNQLFESPSKSQVDKEAGRSPQ